MHAKRTLESTLVDSQSWGLPSEALVYPTFQYQLLNSSASLSNEQGAYCRFYQVEPRDKLAFCGIDRSNPLT